MKEFYLAVDELKQNAPLLSVGDKVYLSGTVFTARDAAHKRFFENLDNDIPLPFDLNGAVIYYTGPTPTPENLPIGSCGPTSSSRMDAFAPKLYDMGVVATVGKGERSPEVLAAIKRNKALYLCALGGAGALAAMNIKSSEIIAFDDLGCEAVAKLEFKDFPLIVGIDIFGNNIFKK